MMKSSRPATLLNGMPDASRATVRPGTMLRLSGSILALVCAHPALAQATVPPTAPAPQTSTAAQEGDSTSSASMSGKSGDADDIVVTGIRQSLANAQTLKRNADTVVDAITASDIGSLPDRSINEALQRVPGVAINRFASSRDSAHFSVQGSGVTIRGLDYVRSEFNGRDTFAAGEGRGLGFDTVPSELAGSVEVYKNLTADMIEGGIAGTVSVNSRKPFDSKDRVRFLSAGGNWGDLARTVAPQFVGLFSNQWQTSGGSRLGFLIGGSYSKQFNRADSIFLNGFQPRFNAPFDSSGNCTQGRIINEGQPYALRVCDNFPTPAGLAQVYTPLGAGFRSQDFRRQRASVNATAQFENAGGNFLATASYINSYFDEQWTERTTESDNWFPDAGQIYPAGYLDQAGFVYNPNANFAYDKNGVFQSGTLVHSGGAYGPQFIPGGIFTKLSNRSAYNKTRTQDASLNLKWSPTDRLHLAADGQYVKSNVENIDDAINANTTTNVSIDITGKYPRVNFVTPGFDTADYLSSGRSIYYRSAVQNRAINDGDEYAFRGDLSYDLSEDSFLREIRVGGRYAKRQQTVRTNGFNNWGSLSETWIEGGLRTLDQTPALVEQYDYPNFFHGAVGQPLGSPFVMAKLISDNGRFLNVTRSVRTAGASFTPIEERTCLTSLIKGYFCSGEIYRNSEATTAGYASLKFGSDFGNNVTLSGNVGVRYVRTTDESFGNINYLTRNQIIGTAPDFATYCASRAAQPSTPLPVLCRPGVTAAQQQAVLAFANGAATPDSGRSTFDHWLPSFNAKIGSDKLLFRVAASKAISRPNFDQLRNTVTLEYNELTGGFSSRSQNPFLRPVEAWQFDLTAEWYFDKVGSLTASLFYKDLKNVIVSNQATIRNLTNNGVTQSVSVTGPANSTGKTSVKGAEIAYQQVFNFLPGALSGFGTQVSYTFIDVGRITIGPPGYAPSNNLTETGNQPLIDITGLYEKLPLEGLSKHNFNAAVFYDKGALQARMAYSWRSRFLLTRLDCCFPFGPVYNEASGQVDGSVFYRFTKVFQLGLEVQNLFDQTLRTSFVLNKDGLTAPRSWFKSDRQFAVTARASF